ncbi:diguanylate phosphodiesterase, partial [Pseudoalteromonas sp. S3260]
LQENTNAHDYLVLIDIARFADINEGLSHDIGNLLLVAVAQRLQGQHQQTQVVARLGADLFAVVSNEEQLPFAQLQQLLRAPFIAAEHQLHLNFTFGLCTQPHFDSSA